MATRTWAGTTSGNFGTAANWVEGVAPVNSDDVVIADGIVDIDAGLDQSAVNLASFYRGPRYKGKIGTGIATPLKIASALVTIDACRGSDTWLDTGAMNNWDQVIVAGPGANISLKPTTSSPECQLVSGNVRIEGGTFTTIYMNPLIESDLSVYILALTCTLLESQGGSCVIDDTSAAITTIHWGGSMCHVRKGNPTNIFCRANPRGRGKSIVRWDTINAGTDTIVKILTGGIFDASQDDRAKTLDTVYRWAGSKAYYGRSGVITLTNGEKSPSGSTFRGDSGGGTGQYGPGGDY